MVNFGVFTVCSVEIHVWSNSSTESKAHSCTRVDPAGEWHTGVVESNILRTTRHIRSESSLESREQSDSFQSAQWATAEF